MSKLIDLDIDEVSVVDRGANQHSLIAFSKSLHGGLLESSEDSMADDVLLFDETGQAVSEDALEHGMTVLDAEGNEYVFIDDEADEALAIAEDDEPGDDEDDEDDEDPEEVGKAGFSTGLKAGLGGWRESGLNTAGRIGSHMGRNKKKYAAGAGAATALTGGAVVADQMKKSLGDSVIEQLSKAVTESEREEIVAKALNEVEILKAENEQIRQWAEAEHDARVTEAFVSKAAEYNLPVAPAVLGPILKAVAEVLDEEQLDILDEIFTAVGDALFEELGYVGESSNSSVLDQVNAMVSEQVGKADASAEQMTTAMFEANPAAYDAYLAEIGR